MPNPSPVPVAVEYATYLVANDANAAAELARVQGAVDACPALFAEAMGLHVSAANRADTRGAAFTLELPAVLLVAVAP